MNKNPIMLTKAQAASFELFTTEKPVNKRQRIQAYLNSSGSWLAEYRPIRDMGFDTFVLALYNGYEVEKDLSDILLDIITKRTDPWVNGLTIDILHKEVMAAIHDHNLVKFLEEGENYAAPERSDS